MSFAENPAIPSQPQPPAQQPSPGGAFKWVCLGVAVVFLSALLWMVNDIRLQVRQSAHTVQESGKVVQKAGRVIDEDLPEIVQRSRDTSKAVSENLPELLEKSKTVSEKLLHASEALPEIMDQIKALAEDVKRLKELLAGSSLVKHDDSVVAFANGVLNAIEKADGVIGVTKNVGSGLKDTRKAEDWVREERREVFWLAAVRGKSKKEIVEGIVKTKLGFSWHIQLSGSKKHVTLLEWLKKNHPETAALY